MEDYVSFEQAQKLKELGFEWRSNHWYHPLEPDKILESVDYTNHNKFERPYSAPSLAQVAKWLREKGIDIDITLFRDIDARGDNPVIKRYYNCEIAFDEDDEDLYEDFSSYEQALSAGLDRALELLKEEMIWKQNINSNVRMK